jgi:hypothetical protein
VRITIKLEERWGKVLRTHDHCCLAREWVGIFERSGSFPSMVCKASPTFKLRCSDEDRLLHISLDVMVFIVFQIKTLFLIGRRCTKEEFSYSWGDKVVQVKIVVMVKGPKASPFVL